jgi:hypothetical protein
VLTVSISVVNALVDVRIEKDEGKAGCLLCSFGTQAGGEKTMLSVLGTRGAVSSAIRLTSTNA